MGKELDETIRLKKGITDMKKLITLILALSMVLSLAACGSKKVTLEILDTEYAIEDYAICIAKENTELLEQVNAVPLRPSLTSTSPARITP